MDIRTNIEKEIMTNGWWAILVSVDRNKYCSCYNKDGENYKDLDITCPICFGTGFAVIKRMIKIRDRMPNAEDDKAFFGTANKETKIVYTCISSKYSINNSDKLYYIKLDNEGKPINPLEYVKKFNIISVDEKRGNTGNSSFWTLWVEKEKG